MKMISRFSLYGFLKELRFFEPFILLFLRSKGLSFFDIGLLFSFREICINLIEIPSGVVADLYGRKSSMIFSLTSYLISFIIFGISLNVYFLYIAMFLFAIGEAFRTGTHKAMIFDYLREENRLAERSRVYGYTRSWSQKGSALSVLIGSLLVFYTENYSYVFWFSVLPYAMGIWNMYCYPEWLNKKREVKINLSSMSNHLWKTFKEIIRVKEIRGLIVQSFVFTGQYKSTKHYLQPIIKFQVATLPFFLFWSEEKRVAILIGCVYFLLYFLTSFFTKEAFKVEKIFGHRTFLVLFVLIFLVQILIGLGLFFNIYTISIVSFILFFILFNIWRPIFFGKFDEYAVSGNQATILSIESQGGATGTFLMAPVLGFIADQVGVFGVFYASALISIIYIVFNFYICKENRSVVGHENNPKKSI